jgi:fucose permease
MIKSNYQTALPQTNIMPMIIVAGLFFILGFATWLNGSLMPYLQQILKLSPFEASLIIFSFYIAVTLLPCHPQASLEKLAIKMVWHLVWLP